MSRLYPGAARSLVEQAMKAGWTGAFGEQRDRDRSIYVVNLTPKTGVPYVAKWRLKDGRWQAWYAERRDGSTVDQVRLDEIAAAIKASVTP